MYYCRVVYVGVGKKKISNRTRISTPAGDGGSLGPEFCAISLLSRLAELGGIKLLSQIGLRRDMLGYHVKKYMWKFTMP
jgi:hypothetical protein